MAAKAYILIETVVGKGWDVAQEMRGLPEVETVDPVIGPYDVIAVVRASDLNAVGDLVSRRIHAIEGITHTNTCLAVGST